MDLESVKKVVGVVTQGRGSGLNNNLGQFVSSYKVQYSNDKNTWNIVNNINNNIFEGNNSASDTKKSNIFLNPITARYIRIYPQTFTNHISMRVALLIPLVTTVPTVSTVPIITNPIIIK